MELVREFERYTRPRPLTACGQCGDRIYMPEWSECLDAHRVRHAWKCEACGYAFETTVRFAAPVETVEA